MACLKNSLHVLFTLLIHVRMFSLQVHLQELLANQNHNMWVLV